MRATDGLKVAVLGGAGFVGGELLRLLSAHPGVGALRAFSSSHAGKPWSDAHPSLAHVPPACFETPDPGGAARWADALFLALPHGRSQALVPELGDAAALVVDTAADFRISDRARYERAYGPHACFGTTASFVYGLADVAGAALAGRRRVAAPGCFATAALLALWPFAGCLDGTPVVFGVTGSSGAGVEPRRTTHHPVRAHSFFAYSVDGHRHEAEIGDRLDAWGAPAGCRLVTHAAPLVRGIHATAHLRLSRPDPRPLDRVAAAYAGRPFVRITPQPPELAAVVGTNFAHVHAAAREGGSEAVVTVAIDNLVKGGAGQAVQAANLALGLAETSGLSFPGLFPC